MIFSTALTPVDVAAMVERRVAGLPLEHVVGWAEFCGLRITVDPGVFVPRRRTEFLVNQAAELTGQVPVESAEGPRKAVVVDLCCGSGALGAALAAAMKRAYDEVELHAADLDPAAVRCARRNLTGPGNHVYEGDLYDPLPSALRGRVDVLVASPPYVPTRAIGLLPPEARLHEPHVALDGGPDGLDVVRRVITEAVFWLAPGGSLLVETSERQAEETAEAVARHGLVPTVAWSEEWDATAIIGTRPA
ncbi:methylase [Planotetraspora thailandica]|uniref:peptide chain release factor N(5)-glutamine methyltransferase n=1 Tax=Planotetraspora thailandica TaxID=487172 RepID=A0A8J3V881_9ACTN|nr:methylase [Planotetraspora thailandica]